MPSQEDIDAITARLRTYRTTLQIYLQQVATFGSAHTPPAIFHGIDECRQNIQQIKHTLRSWDAYVEDFWDDEQVGQHTKDFLEVEHPYDILQPSQNTAIITITDWKVERDTIRVRLFPKAIRRVIEEAREGGYYNELLFDYYYFESFIKNIGTHTITAFKSHIIISPEEVIYEAEEILEFANGGQNPRNRDEASMKVCIYPQDTLRISSYELILFSHDILQDKNVRMDWMIYVNDQAPSRGSIDISHTFRRI